MATPPPQGSGTSRSFPVVQSVLAVVAALLLLAWWVPLRSTPLTVTFTRGGAMVESRDGERVELAPGDVVGQGQRLVVPEGASVNLSSPEGHEITATDSTVLEMSKGQGTFLGGKVRMRLDVEHGSVRITGEARAGTSLDLGLPHGVAGVRGTVFVARVGDGMDLVSVHQGSVGVNPADGPGQELVPGEGALVRAGGLDVRDLPSPPDVLSPDGGSLISDPGTAVTWAPVPGAARYIVEFARDPAFLQVMARVEAVDTSAIIPPLDEDLPAQVRVFAVTAEGLEGPSSAERTLHVRLRRARGLALLAQGDAASAIAELEAALPNYADDVELLKELGWAFYVESRHAEARTYYERARALEPGDEELLLEVGRVYFWLGEYDEAEVAYRAVLAESPDDADALWGLGDTYREMGRTDEALELVERALRVRPDHPYATETLRRLREGR